MEEIKIKPEKISILNGGEIREFIEHEKMSPEDISLIEELSLQSRISDFHNFFYINQEHSERHLLDAIDRSKNYPETVRACELFIIFCKKYGWHKSSMLQSMIEAYQRHFKS
jgi:hypothetical protein